MSAANGGSGRLLGIPFTACITPSMTMIAIINCSQHRQQTSSFNSCPAAAARSKQFVVFVCVTQKPVAAGGTASREKHFQVDVSKIHQTVHTGFKIILKADIQMLGRTYSND